MPVVDTAVIPAETIQAEIAASERDERAVRRRHLRRRAVAWLVVLLLLAVAALVIYLGFLR